MKLSSNGLVDSEKTIVLIYSWDSMGESSKVNLDPWNEFIVIIL